MSKICKCESKTASANDYYFYISVHLSHLVQIMQPLGREKTEVEKAQMRDRQTGRQTGAG